MAKCSGLLDAKKCDLVIDTIHAEFGDLVPKSTMTHHRIELTARCIQCDQKYWYTLYDLKVDEFGQLWRTAVFSKEFKPV